MTSFSSRTLLTLLAACLLLLLIQEGRAAPRCTQYDLPAPTGCKYGTTRDWCRNGVCAKGPGERCGGHWRSAGKCGEGTYCSCGVCAGCSPFDGSCARVISLC